MLTDDGFLNGRLQISQPARGYRAGVDPVFLAAAVPANPGDRVLELGCGAGTAILCLAARVRDLDLWGLELQSGYAALAAQNAAQNGVKLNVVEGDVRDLPPSLKEAAFDHIMMNPPYFDRASRIGAQETGREIAMSDTAPPSDWCDAALRRLRPGGSLTLIQVPGQLPDLLAAIAPRASTTIYPLLPRSDRDAHRVILQARKGGKAGTVLAAPTVLHRGLRHTDDRPDYTDAAQAVLRDAAPWPWIGG